MSSELLVGKETYFVIRNAGTDIRNEVFEHRGDNEVGGSDGGKMGVEQSLPGTLNKREAPARKAAGRDGAVKIPVYVGRTEKNVGHDEDTTKDLL